VTVVSRCMCWTDVIKIFLVVKNMAQLSVFTDTLRERVF
jgi:hypothetical protein